MKKTISEPVEKQEGLPIETKALIIKKAYSNKRVFQWKRKTLKSNERKQYGPLLERKTLIGTCFP